MMMHNFFGDNLFDNENWPDTSFDREFFAKMNPLYGKHAKDVMLTDVRKTDQNYEVVMDLPGFKKEDIQIHLDKGYLTIAAVKKEETKEQDEAGIYLRQERYTGSMRRTFYVGDHMTPGEVKAKYEDGVLTLTLPRKEAVQVEHSGQIAIEG
ncbi:Hsp20/alpha crystallin family protein [Anaerotignum sp.]|uniref:Hsp20/alpha crystallin family protein n=1 Tax=Anaerotignum sp. TaxID=2039241 RepID=UPI002FE6D565|nr:Hsp20/alpha crystallin family protein [Clostridia bacterium]